MKNDSVGEIEGMCGQGKDMDEKKERLRPWKEGWRYGGLLAPSGRRDTAGGQGIMITTTTTTTATVTGATFSFVSKATERRLQGGQESERCWERRQVAERERRKRRKSRRERSEEVETREKEERGEVAAGCGKGEQKPFPPDLLHHGQTNAFSTASRLVIGPSLDHRPLSEA
ncbi:hypothetical protein E2C01_061676 [Portunus trituberculatus]|uniref:Uncharacterized protein n=1 Tax=Portunus trituberculatus TaxID=210409 RepID=A0A5B7HCI1_PORTR|nr:hypothetical protein [Portunus trituberculatus]